MINRSLASFCILVFGLGVVVATAWSAPGASMTIAQLRSAAEKQFEAGNFKEALSGFQQVLQAEPSANLTIGRKDADHLVQCLQRLARESEADALLEAIATKFPDDWRTQTIVADRYLRLNHFGFIVAGKFERGQHRGSGEHASVARRDRGRCLQRMVAQLPKIAAERPSDETNAFYLVLAEALQLDVEGDGDWQLQVLTDLATLPDPELGFWWHRGHNRVYAPVQSNGTPVFYTVPAEFAAAQNDGQRWRWALAQVAKYNDSQHALVEFTLAQFYDRQFGQATLADYGVLLGRADDNLDQANDALNADDEPKKSGTFALETLTDDETIARLASGVRRFKLPDEFNYLKIFQRLAQGNSAQAPAAADRVANILTDRRQYVRAAAAWQDAIKRFGSGENKSREQALQQITGNWGRFESTLTQPTGRGAELEFRFRNAHRVTFTATQIDVDRLLADVKDYLKRQPTQLDWNKTQIDNLGNRLVVEGQARYLGAQVAEWKLDLEPRAEHFDRRVTVTTPLQKAGAYLVRAEVEGGNRSQIVVWLADTVIVKKPLDNQAWYYVADAVTGRPIERANVEFFGWRQQHVRDNQWRVNTTNFAAFTDSHGQTVQQPRPDDGNYQWLVTARTDSGRLAFLGWTGIWRGTYDPQRYLDQKVYVITDRPVYRPKQRVEFKAWVRVTSYGQDSQDVAPPAGTPYTVQIFNPKGEKLFDAALKADAFGGVTGHVALPADAALGVYNIQVAGQGGNSFRVEEYKKPEFEVTVQAPERPVALGEKIPVQIEARYYFGAPVTEARVKYKITRTKYDEPWYPIGRWDWLYGVGYGWQGGNSPWLPGWNRWGCMRPIGWWWPRPSDPPEVVAEVEAPIGPDGKLSVEIDTTLAKEIHGRNDHRYAITAEVVDASRRTIVGAGEVLVARRPFKVFAWADRGYYRAGDTMKARFLAQTIDRRPVRGDGELRLLKITYNEQREPQETVVERWPLATNAQGEAVQQIVAADPGQYRLAYSVTDESKHTIEGGCVVTVTGERFDGRSFRFDHLELLTDKSEYAPGDKVRLLITADRADSQVLVFLRPSNGVYLPPQFVTLVGKTATVEFDITARDMPNCFVEAVTIADGSVHQELKELIVPPASRALNVKVEPSAEKYLPGQPAEIKLTITDDAGQPVVGSTVVSVYDKSVEYIAGGSNVPEIRAFFWKWRRQHTPQGEHSLNRGGDNLLGVKDWPMTNLGLFGDEVADLPGVDGNERFKSRSMTRRGRMAGIGGANAMMADTLMAPAPAAAPEGLAFAESTKKLAKAQAPGEPAGGPALVQPTVRANFADTALWVAALETDAAGQATVKLKMPENLTTWKIRTWAIGPETSVGEATVDVVTSKNLLVRLQAPRFFVQTDEVVLSANVHNYLPDAKQVQVSLELDGSTIAPPADAVKMVTIAAGGEARVDWRVKVVGDGEATVRMKALSDVESDATEQQFPCYVHGMLKTVAVSGAIRPTDSAGQFTFEVPAARRPEQSRFELRYSPSLAGALVDALPYLVDYPYGCTEQTLNRFVPTVVVQKILTEMQLDLAGIETKRANLNAQQLGDERQRAAGWKRFDRNPVFDRAEVDRMVADGLRRLTDMQCSDGGWGWFSGSGEHSFPHTTAVVVHGLQTANSNGVALVPGLLERGLDWLANYQTEQVRLLQRGEAKKPEQPYRSQADALDALVYGVLVDAGRTNDAMLGYLDRDRTKLPVYAKALFGMALVKQGGQAEKLAVVMQNLSQYVEQDEENQTAWLRLPNESRWYWYGSGNEAMAYYLKLLAATEPRGELTARLAKYLLNSRQHGTYWNSTRDTALCVEALADFWRASGEQRPDLQIEIVVDGQVVKQVAVTPDNLFTFDNKLVLDAGDLTAGRHTVELRKTGSGPIYYNAYTTNFTLEDPIAAAGLEVKVARKLYRLERDDQSANVAGSRGQAVGQRVERYTRHLLGTTGEVRSGDLIEVELELESKNDYEYLLFEDLKAAGCEPVEIRSGYGGNALGAYMELRDERVAFFLRTLPRGRHSVSYRLRAETPGRFSALPARASAMYAPELTGNSDESKLIITE